MIRLRKSRVGACFAGAFLAVALVLFALRVAVKTFFIYCLTGGLGFGRGKPPG